MLPRLIGPDKGALASAQLLALRLTAEGKARFSRELPGLI